MRRPEEKIRSMKKKNGWKNSGRRTWIPPFPADDVKPNRYDFGRYDHLVIRAFEENKNILANYQEKYQYILVDEYQDTSGNTEQAGGIADQLLDKPNVFVVGDDDQSIYRFQGITWKTCCSSPLIIKTISWRWCLTKLPVNTTDTRYLQNPDPKGTKKGWVKQLDGLSKELLSSNDSIRDLKHPPVIHEYETQREEMIGIVKQVQELVAWGVVPGRIGIIYKENKYGEELSRYFKLKYPFTAKGTSTFSNCP